MNLNGKLRKKLGNQTGGQPKILGAVAHPAPALGTATDPIEHLWICMKKKISEKHPPSLDALQIAIK